MIHSQCLIQAAEMGVQECANARQEDDDAIRTTLQKAGVEPADIGLAVVNKSKVEVEGSTGSFRDRVCLC